jgi:glycine cleavage system H protein
MAEFVAYRRCRFAARFPTARLYTAGHSWLCQRSGGVWRVGLTKFGTRLVGEVVELGFHLEPGASVRADDVVGFVEGFKGISDLRASGTGSFLRANPGLATRPNLLNDAPHGRGWLYEFAGHPAPETMVVARYCACLDRVIDATAGGSAGT